MATADIATEIPRPATGTPNWLARIDAGRIFTHIALLFLVALWTFPTAGLLVSSLRDKDQLAVSGWWTALTTSQTLAVTRLPTADTQVQRDGKWVITGNVFGTDSNKQLGAFGTSNNEPAAAVPGASLPMSDGGTITIQVDGSFVWSSDKQFTFTRAPRIFYEVAIPPRFTLDN